MHLPDPADLEACLDATRAALMAGDMDALAKLAELVETARAAGSAPNEAAARRIKSKAEHNGRMLQAALKGVRAARQRAQELGTQGRFSTYDAGGRRDQHGLASAIPARRL
jgi:hypothetical protein